MGEAGVPGVFHPYAYNRALFIVQEHQLIPHHNQITALFCEGNCVLMQEESIDFDDFSLYHYDSVSDFYQ